VGVNRHELEQDSEVEILRIDPVLERKQVDRVRAVRARRDSAAVEAALARLKEASLRDENVMPSIVGAARAYATLGEMCDALRDTWGTWTESPVF
jgi:methylmalonyl-CoA mutase N-terminal domain/subunit